MKVYLCGPIEGLTPEEYNAWRTKATEYLFKFGIKTVNPARRLSFHSQVYNVNLSKRTVALDFMDIDGCDIVLANLKDRGDGKCWGSVAEITYASLTNKVVITVLEPGFKHPFIDTLSTELHSTLDEALRAVEVYAK